MINDRDTALRRKIALFVAEDRREVVPVAKSARDEATKAGVLLLPGGKRHVIVVTSSMLARRARATFEGVG